MPKLPSSGTAGADVVSVTSDAAAGSGAGFAAVVGASSELQATSPAQEAAARNLYSDDMLSSVSLSRAGREYT